MDKTIYLDNAATSLPKAPGVGAAMADYLEHVGCNIGRGAISGPGMPPAGCWRCGRSCAPW